MRRAGTIRALSGRFATFRRTEGMETEMEVGFELPLVPTVAVADGDARVNLYGLTLAELEAFVVGLGQPRFRAGQLFGWLYGRGASSFSEMTDLSKSLREQLASVARIDGLELTVAQRSQTGTVKMLWTLTDGRQIESVLIPDPYLGRLTACVSSQVGCALKCGFCATGFMGFTRHLSPGEIYGQLFQMDRWARENLGETGARGLTNVVYMGMGEPLHNYDAVMTSTELLTDPRALGFSPKRVTVSTSGLVPQIRRIADEQRPFRLALSLHAPTDEQRSALMPINRRYPLDELIDAIRYYTMATGKRVTYEYILFEGQNDSLRDADQLAKLAARAPCKINLIPYNPVEGASLTGASFATAEAFAARLLERGVRVTVRKTMGVDIDAACGQLAVKNERRVRTAAAPVAG